MKPKQNDHVKLIFKTGIVEEGIVIEWSDGNSVIKSLHNDNILIIQNTIENIIAIKIISFSEDKILKPKEQVYVDTPEPSAYIRDEQLRAKHLSELHSLRKKEEEKRARSLLNTFVPTETLQPVNYGYPKLQQPPNINNNTRKETYKRIK